MTVFYYLLWTALLVTFGFLVTYSIYTGTAPSKTSSAKLTEDPITYLLNLIFLMAFFALCVYALANRPW